jgi:hypothetical protein
MAHTLVRQLEKSFPVHQTRSILIHASPEKVFAFVDDIHNTGMHMEKSSMPMMGSKMSVEIVSKQNTGLGATYHWVGNVMGLPIDFSETVTDYIPNRLRVWRTIREPKIIIMGSYEMRLSTDPQPEGTLLTIEIDYEYPRPIFWNLVGRLLAGWYGNWCLNNMTNDAKTTLEAGRA